MVNRLAKVDIKRFSKAVHEYVEAQQTKKANDEIFEKAKNKFADAADIYFKLKGNDDSETFEELDGSVTVSKVQKVSVQWNIDKLMKAVGKQVSKSIILKRYEITDMLGLVTYLQECGVDPKIFKSFISVEESVDVKELERLEELGKISKEQLKGCYSVKCQKPYYQVRKGRKVDGE